MRTNQQTFNGEISEVLDFYRSVARRQQTPMTRFRPVRVETRSSEHELAPSRASTRLTKQPHNIN